MNIKQFILDLFRVRQDKIELSSLDSDKSILYQKLINVLNDYYLKTQIDENNRIEIEKQEEYLNEFYYNQKFRGDIATSLILENLKSNLQGELSTTIKLLNSEGELEDFSLKAYIIDEDSFRILEEYGKDAEMFNNSEGFTFNFIVNPDFGIMEVPECNCGDYEISAYFTVEENCIDSNCDTWGTMVSSKGKSLYLLYIKDIDKYAVVKVSYWCM